MKGRYIRVVSDGPSALDLKVYDVMVDGDYKVIPGSEVERTDVRSLAIDRIHSDGWIEAEMRVASPVVDLVAYLREETGTCAIPGCEGLVHEQPGLRLCDRHLLMGISGSELARLLSNRGR